MFSLQWPSSWRSPACTSSMLIQWWSWPAPDWCSNINWQHHSSMTSKIRIWYPSRGTGTISSHPYIHNFDGSLDEESQQNQDQTLWNPGNSRSPLYLDTIDQIHSFLPNTVWNVETVLILLKFWNIEDITINIRWCLPTPKLLDSGLGYICINIGVTANKKRVY